MKTLFAVLLLAFFPVFPPAAAAAGGASTETEPDLFSFADVVRVAKEAVVNIQTDDSSPADALKNNDFLLWRLFGGENPGESREQTLGTGFIIRKNGLILTNEHVVEDRKTVRVKLADEEILRASVVGRDSRMDIAILHIDADRRFPVIPFGDSEALEVGEWVAAIGNPFGLEQTVTVGIVSGKGRVIGMGPYDDYIQTDASINPGNSGGPLLNVRGEVIGINSAIRSQGNGIGFAIPIHQVRKILPQLEREGKVSRGWLGVMIQDIGLDNDEGAAPPVSKGVLLADVFEGGPADIGGLHKGDIVVEFDGEKIERSRDLPFIVAATPIGKVVQVKAIRDGREKTFGVKIGRLEEDK
jgi:serine protease Do